VIGGWKIVVVVGGGLSYSGIYSFAWIISAITGFVSRALYGAEDLAGKAADELKRQEERFAEEELNRQREEEARRASEHLHNASGQAQDGLETARDYVKDTAHDLGQAADRAAHHTKEQLQHAGHVTREGAHDVAARISEPNVVLVDGHHGSAASTHVIPEVQVVEGSALGVASVTMALVASIALLL